MKVSEHISQSSDVLDKSQNTTGEEVLTTNYYNSRPNASFRKLTVNSNLTSQLEAVPASCDDCYLINCHTDKTKEWMN